MWYTGRVETRIFAYGSLMNPDVLRGLIGRAPALSPARLPGYRRIMNAVLRGHIYLNLMPSASFVVEGVLFDVNDEEFKKIEEYEVGYRRYDISNQLAPPHETPVYVYIIPGAKSVPGTVTREYMDRCLGGVAPEKRDAWLAETLIQNEIVD